MPRQRDVYRSCTVCTECLKMFLQFLMKYCPTNYSNQFFNNRILSRKSAIAFVVSNLFFLKRSNLEKNCIVQPKRSAIFLETILAHYCLIRYMNVRLIPTLIRDLYLDAKSIQFQRFCLSVLLYCVSYVYASLCDVWPAQAQCTTRLPDTALWLIQLDRK